MRPKRMAGLTGEFSLDDLAELMLARLEERELRMDLLIDYLQASPNGTLSPEEEALCREFLRENNAAIARIAKPEQPTRTKLDQALAQRLAERHRLDEELNQAIANQTLSLVFEPIVTPMRTCCMVEALARWTHPKRGPVPPSVFIPIAERTGDIVEIGRWVLLEACREAQSWPGECPPAVSVNVSPAQIMTGSFVSDVLAALGKSGLPPHRLQIEITENVFASKLKFFNSILAELRRSSIRIALDDFGTGFSSLSYLRTLRIDRIKIDRSFLELVDAESISILQAIVTMARALGLETIAEGIETTAQAECAASLGVHYLQGFLFAGMSLKPNEIRDWLTGHLTSRCA